MISRARVVRMVLLPAFMHVLGTWCWWAPKSLARLHERFGITEKRKLPHAAMVPATHAIHER